MSDEPEFYVPEVWRGKSADKKQGSDGVINMDIITNTGGPYTDNYKETMAEYIFEENLVVGIFLQEPT